MDPAVFRAAKQYWFKSAPGHEGIHGLHTAPWRDGKTACFVGSACTLEILDAEGNLTHRMPIFWGPGHVMQTLPRADGSIDLLVAREPTDGEAVAVINSATQTETGRGFWGVPEGHTYVGGWAAMSRDHLYHVDMDGDGKREVVSEVNGIWNRVGVWNEAGEPLYSATFGPGEPIPVRNMRGLVVLDLDHDDKQELVTATSSGLLVALDRQCNKLWSRRLPRPATALLALDGESPSAPRLAIACQDGTLILADATGAPLARAQVSGHPTRIVAIPGPQPSLAVATDSGELSVFAPPLRP
jgi:hypothetical protein